MGNTSSSSKTKTADSVRADSVRQEINQIITKLGDARKRLTAEEDNDEKKIISREIKSLISTQTSLNDEYDKLTTVAPAGAAAVAPALNTPNTQPIYNARNAPGSNQPVDLSVFDFPNSDSDSPSSDSDSGGGTMKNKNSKRKNSKRKNSKRKNSKRKNSKRKNSKRKNSKRK